MSLERLVSVFARGDDLFFEPNCRSTSGLWLSAGPIGRLSRNATAGDLGAAVRAALAESRQDVPHPVDWRAFSPPILAAARVRSWMKLQRTAAKCQIESGPDGLRVLPSRNGGPKGDDRGYHTLAESAIVLAATASDDELGAAVLSALDACR